jgi:pimeloyl-ACP methyl ester carboxylesterase
MRKLLVVLLGICFIFLGLIGCSTVRRKLLFFPSHHTQNNGLTAWKSHGEIIGYARQVPAPENVWLMLHGNGGQAADRVYALPCFSGRDSVFILEYPGYGLRKGKPSRTSLDASAKEAYQLLRNAFPTNPVCVVGESIGTGPTCMLATQSQQPNKIMLIVPFDELVSVAADHAPYLPVGLILGSTWDNIRSLSGYTGPVEIVAALEDRVIKIEHAKKLANAVPLAKFRLIAGGHNDWSTPGRVQIRNP